MEFVNHKTNSILLRAYTDSEWDYCDFAIVNFEEWHYKLFNDCMNKFINDIKKDYDYYFYKLVFNSMADFYVIKDSNDFDYFNKELSAEKDKYLNDITAISINKEKNNEYWKIVINNDSYIYFNEFECDSDYKNIKEQIDNEKILNFLENNKQTDIDWNYITLTGEENFKAPQQQLEVPFINIDCYKTINFETRGKYSADDFYTLHIPLEKLLK